MASKRRPARQVFTSQSNNGFWIDHATVLDDDMCRAIDEQRERARSDRPVEIMVAGAGVYICDQCVEGCVEYINAVRAGRSG